ncbi:metallophosphoesterase [Hyalangium sp.]|uniref:metallophosphoesterase n=1 Tax=Hyalangium sp. TaxID=2028555 RepID=UPI002D51C1C3|nr:metallophosphoesterase [Hyalangium sp.]HYI00985.1 metallophosphoesterase [Hyalangium sp.]
MMIGRLVLIAVLNLLGYAVLRRLWPAVSSGWRQWTFVSLVALSLLAWGLPMLLGIGIHGQIPVIGAPLKLFSTMWAVAVLIVVLFGTPFVLARWWRQRRSASQAGQVTGVVDLERRSVLMSVGRAVPFVAMGTSSAGVVSGISGFEVRELEVRLRDLPAALEGFRIGQITDIHVGPFITTDYLRAAVEAMNSAGVHLQVMTGDLIDDLSQVDGTMEALGACQAPHGMLAILGNHEHWRGLESILEGYESLAKRGAKVRLLVDESHVLEHGGERLRVVGVDYPMSRRNPLLRAQQMRRSADVAFQGTSPGEMTLCLAHHPSFFPYAAERGAHLTLAGHTHGGQVAFFGVPLFWFAFEFMLGRYKQKDSHLYVSGGTGHWLPFRLGVPTEVTILTLRRA